MTSPDLFLSHGLDDVQLAAAVVDFLEEAIPAVEGHIDCTAVPGYGAEGASTRDNALTIALWPQGNAQRVVADLLLAVDRGHSAVVLCLDPANVDLPRALAEVTQLPMDRGGLSNLMEDVTYALGVLPHMTDAGRDALTELLLTVHRHRNVRTGMAETPLHVVRPLPPPPRVPQDVTESPDSRAPEPPAAPVDSQVPEPPAAPVDSQVPEPPAAPVDSQVPDPHSAPVKVREPADAMRCSQVGALLAECLFHELPLRTLDTQPGGQVSSLYEVLGGLPRPLDEVSDAEAWQARFDELLEALPPERKPFVAWYDAGFQLALACALAAEVIDASDAVALDQARADAWTSFAASADELRLPAEFVLSVSNSITALMNAGAERAGERGAGSECLHILFVAAHARDEQRAAARRDRQLMQA